jgi:hypothetical protein
MAQPRSVKAASGLPWPKTTLRNLTLALMVGAMMIGPALAGPVAEGARREACFDYGMTVEDLFIIARSVSNADDMIVTAGNTLDGAQAQIFGSLSGDERAALASNLFAYARTHTQLGDEGFHERLVTDCQAGMLDFLSNAAPQ